jgi:RNA polymerase sigma-70 factor (ECF subfamily)
MFFKRFAQKADEELMRLVQQGHEKAMTELYARYSKSLIRYFNRMLWFDGNKAQDFLHDLFIKIIENPQYFKVDKKFSTWLYSVAHNMCKNEYRKQSNRKSVDNEKDFIAIADNEILEKIDQQKFLNALEKSMITWDEDDRTLFTLRYENELTFAEIGLILECPEGTVKSRWFYLRKNLAKQFQDFHPALN